jgi:hypothetical protein
MESPVALAGVELFALTLKLALALAHLPLAFAVASHALGELIALPDTRRPLGGRAVRSARLVPVALAAAPLAAACGALWRCLSVQLARKQIAISWDGEQSGSPTTRARQPMGVPTLGASEVIGELRLSVQR